ncbi:MAG: VOC family protein [Candidatus Melainabacteria bacterium]|nr:VOC family protein [Candidatus Melainabacteria bacterium]
MSFKRNFALALLASLSVSLSVNLGAALCGKAETGAVSPIPEGYHSLTPTFVFKDAKKAIEFYRKAFGAEQTELIEHEGKVMHGEVKIGDSHLMLSDEFPEGDCLAPKDGLGYMSLYLYVNDVDKAYKQAVDSGAKSKMEPCNMFWGDRYASVQDPFGYVWQIASRKEKLSSDEVKKRSDQFFSSIKETK